MLEPIPFAGWVKTGLDEQYDMSQAQIAEKMFLALGTVASTEKRAIQMFKDKLVERNIDVKDLLP